MEFQLEIKHLLKDLFYYIKFNLSCKIIKFYKYYLFYIKN
jgi:hypothetical protein